MSKQNILGLPSWAQLAVLGSTVLILYITTLTSWHSGDDLQLALKVESAITGQPVLHPAYAASITSPNPAASPVPPEARYLLELPTLQWIGSFSRTIQWTNDSTLPVQLTHAIFGAAGVVFFFLALTWFMPLSWGFVISLGLAFSYAWWYYSTHLDYTIISHTLSCILLYLLTVLFYSQSRLRIHWLVITLGVVSGLAILYLLTNFLLIPVTLVALLLSKRARSEMGLYLLSMILTVVTVGSFIWIINAGVPPSLEGLLDNLTYSGASAHGFVYSDIPKSLYGFSKALLTYPLLDHQPPNAFFASSNILGRIFFLVFHLLLIIIVLLPFVLLARLYRQLEMHRNLVITLLVWFSIQFPFGIYWEPSYIKWWTGALIPWWSLVGLLLVTSSVRSASLYKAISWLISALVFIFFGVNLFSDFLPNAIPERNPWLLIASTLGDATGENDLFLSPGYHPLDFYLPYFGRRHTLSYGAIVLVKGSEAANRDISEAVQITTEQGGRIFLYSAKNQDISELKNILASPAIQYEPVRFENTSAADFVIYQVTGLSP